MAPKLNRVLRLDSVALDKTYFSPEGYLVDHPIVTSTGIFEYTNPDGSIRRELRLPEEVFKKESLESYKGKPIIITHEAGYVTKDNVDQEHIGTILSEGYRDGDDVRAEIVIHDTDAMKRAGLRELSLGYGLDMDETPGEWNGQPYDAIQRDITVNHLALVRNARAGEQARLNIDSRSAKTVLKGGKSMSYKTGGIKNPGKKKPARRLDSKESFLAKVSALWDEEIGAVDSEDVYDSEHEGAVEAAHKVDNEGVVVLDPEALAAMDSDEKLAFVKDRRDRRDSEGLASMEEAYEYISHQDEDIDLLLDIIEGSAHQGDSDDEHSNSDSENCDEDHTDTGDDDHADEDEHADDDDNQDEEEKQDSSESQSRSMNADSVDRIVSQKLELARVGEQLGLVGLEKKPIRAARVAVIQKVNPKIRLDGKSDAYIRAAYDMARAGIKPRKTTADQRKKMFNKDGVTVLASPPGKSTAEQHRQKMIERRQNGGK